MAMMRELRQALDDIIIDSIMNDDDIMLENDPNEVSEVFSKKISDAHTLTCLYKLEHIHEMFRKSTDVSRLLFLNKNLSDKDVWLDCAQKLTVTIRYIIEFAKLAPGFLKLSKDDQIILLKAGCFEIAIIRMSRCLDPSRNCVLFGDMMLPQDVFFTPYTTEFVKCVFGVARSIEELKLTETEIALYSAYVLFSPDRSGLKAVAEISRLSQAILRALRLELDRNHSIPIERDVTVCDVLLTKISSLREVNMFHIDTLRQIKRFTVYQDFSPLYRELFTEEVLDLL